MKQKEKGKKLFEAINHIEEDLVEEALSYDDKRMDGKKRKSRKKAAEEKNGYRYRKSFIPAFAVVLLLLMAGAASVFCAHRQQGERDEERRLKKLEHETAYEGEDGEKPGMMIIKNNNEDGIQKLLWSGNATDLTGLFRANEVNETIGKAETEVGTDGSEMTTGDSRNIETLPESETEKRHDAPDAQQFTTEVSQEFVESSADFAIALFKECAKVKKNICISPLSAQLVLSMAANGAAGDTRQQMEKVLGGGQQIEELNRNLNTYTNQLKYDEKSRIKLADSIWIRNNEDAKVKETFLSDVKNWYYSSVFEAPFDETTKEDINYWISENTDGYIRNMIDEIGDEAVLYLVNTVLFSGRWLDPYLNAVAGEFNAYRGEKESGNFMHSVEMYYIEDEYATGFCKPYTSGYLFVAILPNEEVDIFDYIASLTGEHFLSMMQDNYGIVVEATIPKFSVTGKYDFSEALKKMGMENAFLAEKADFSELFVNDSAILPYIGKVFQNTYMDVDEQGTDAAASTAAEVRAGSAASTEKKVVDIDRPFIYAIVDYQNKLPIFMGVVTSLKE